MHKKREINENLWAVLLGLVIIGLIIMTTDSSPLWIYQGF
jgi:hypothetical protein